jgi:hypothetical protein
MSAKALIALIAVVTAASAEFSVPPAAAQGVNTEYPGGPLLPPQLPRRRIEIYPQPQSQLPVHRRCVDWYELQNRPSGQVLYPQMRCWWVRG